ncbi:DUF4330 domain-containing protein [Rubeoparvulum massiliense]|uniref:DUF4330 domain-containing protein n=1 Tax=Rubeoparvulum massiliense TaxID=1631346 RepID=UPI00065E3D91|nr:DUF4330 domain-containing protein [Rubeoparvulum massiliense]
MKLIDEKGKLFGLVNIVDLLIVVVVLGLAAGVYYKVTQSNRVVETVPVTLTLLAEEIRQPTVDAIAIGDDAYDWESNGYFGKVVDKQVTPAIAYVETADGRVVKAEIPDKYNLTVTIEGSGVYQSRGVVIGGRDWKVGNTLVLKTQKSSVKTTVIGLVQPEAPTQE